MPLHPRRRIGLYTPEDLAPKPKKETRASIERREALERMYPRPEVDLQHEFEHLAKVQQALGIVAIDIETDKC